MYLRIARFEAGDRDWDELAAGVGDSLRAGGQGTPIEAVADAIKRVVLLVDRENTRGGRTSVETYEVLLDEQPAA